MLVPSSFTYAIGWLLLHEQSDPTLAPVVDDDVRSIDSELTVLTLRESEKGSDGVGESDHWGKMTLALGSSSDKDTLGAGNMGAKGGMGKLITGGDKTCPKNAEK